MSKSEDFGDGVSGAFCHWVVLGDFSVGHNGLGSWDDDTHMYGVHDRRRVFLKHGGKGKPHSARCSGLLGQADVRCATNSYD